MHEDTMHQWCREGMVQFFVLVTKFIQDTNKNGEQALAQGLRHEEINTINMLISGVVSSEFCKFSKDECSKTSIPKASFLFKILC
jgi:hypothetical protein